ncbi:hypothetical protein HK101_007262 [Irineochytrium annulatum]|nr:hypothetical protein HK101_007262 [Irineochytrium annulatum]
MKVEATASSTAAVASLAEIAEKAIIDDIIASVKAVNASHYCGGTLTVPHQLKLYVDPPSTHDNEAGDGVGGANWITFPLQPKALDVLLAACKPATFGLGSKDTYDPSYREALALATDSFLINFDPHGPLLAEIIQTLARKDCDVVPQLYKLNVYGPGGHFKAHVDTPRAASMFGSLVVCLPSAHTGGQLVLTHNGDRKVFDWGGEGRSGEPGRVQWAAFYSDVTHEILPVTDKHRVTLTYNLHWATKVGGLLSDDPARVRVDFPISRMMSRALSQPGFFLDGCVLGFSLQHDYPITNAGWSQDMRLKGSDAVLYDAMKSLNLEVHVTPIYKARVYENEEDEEDEEPGEERKSKRTYGSSYIKGRYEDEVLLVGRTFHARSTRSLEDDRGRHEILVQDNGALVRDDVVWCTYPSNYKQASAFVAYGNEATLEYLYVAAALLVTIPTWSERLSSQAK